MKGIRAVIGDPTELPPPSTGEDTVQAATHEPGRGLSPRRTCQRLDLGRPGPQNSEKQVSVVSASQSGALGYWGPKGQLLLAPLLDAPAHSVPTLL